MVDDKPEPGQQANSEGTTEGSPAKGAPKVPGGGQWTWNGMQAFVAAHNKRIGIGLALFFLLYNLKEFARFSRYCLFDSTDTGWLVRTGQYIVENGALPRTDIFSWTCHDAPWVVYQWLAEIVMWYVYNAGGLWLIGAVWLTLIALIYFWLLPRQFLRRGVPLAMAFFFLALVLTPSWFFARPQTFSFFFLLAFQALLEWYKSSGKWKVLIALPPLMILWANTHSFWFLGLLMVCCYCVDGPGEKRKSVTVGDLSISIDKADISVEDTAEKKTSASKEKVISLDKNVLICLVITALSLLVNPYGFGLIDYNISFIGNTPSAIAEVGPVELGKHNGFLIYLLLFIYACVRQFPKIGWGRAFLSAFLLVGAACVRRFEPVAIIVTFQYMAMLLEGQLQLQSARQSVPAIAAREFAKGSTTNKVDLMLLTCALVAGIKIWSVTCPDAKWAEAYFRGAATAQSLGWYEKSRTGKERVFCDADTGDWLILHQAGPVFIDTRFDFYGNLFFNEWLDCMEGKPGWDKYLNRYGVTHVILRGNPNLAKLLEKDSKLPEKERGWQKVADDKKIRIWAKISTLDAK